MWIGSATGHGDEAEIEHVNGIPEGIGEMRDGPVVDEGGVALEFGLEKDLFDLCCGWALTMITPLSTVLQKWSQAPWSSCPYIVTGPFFWSHATTISNSS